MANGALSERTAHLLLRVGVAFAFLYPPFAAIADPVSWISYFPDFVRAIPIDSLLLLHGFGAIEVLLALWVLSGWKIRIPATIMTVMLLGIVVFNWASIDVLFRDISLVTMTLALALWPQPRTRAEISS